MPYSFCVSHLRQLFFILLVTFSGCQKQEPKSPVTVDSGETAQNAVTRTSEPVMPEAPFELEPGFTILNRDDFDAIAAVPSTWTATADGIACTGKPKGYLYSKHPYQNFSLRLEYRFPRPKNLNDESKFKGNTGFLVYVTGEHKLWPACLEVQGKHILMAAIKENGGADPVSVEDDEVARNEARKPVGQWNLIEIVSQNGAITASLNGKVISRSKPGQLKNGFIGIQAEDHPFEVRRMRIRTE